MKLECLKCNEIVEISIIPSGPHRKAICSKCKRYIKFLSKEEMREVELEEDKLEEGGEE